MSLATDVGPVITREAKMGIEAHVAAMRARGHAVESLRLGPETAHGTYVAPTIIEINRIADVEREVFGPVLHVLRFPRAGLDRLVDEINATGYGLTFGLHTRIDETIDRVTRRIAAGNIYVNRNIIGAVVGVQPFGGRGMSGTGPKAGGPLYLLRLVTSAAQTLAHSQPDARDPVALNLASWLESRGHQSDADYVRHLFQTSPAGLASALPGPVGEENRYSLVPRGTIYLAPLTVRGLNRQLAAILTTGNRAAIQVAPDLLGEVQRLPTSVAARIAVVAAPKSAGVLAGALIEGEADRVKGLLGTLSGSDGPLVPVQAATSAAIAEDRPAYSLSMLVDEVSISTNTAAAGGNASLMTLS
jgi:RHH-type proline utilization regulon transcriptional repressor/proline dehydrogenase/delta 1-pyrroline-5-carboxylate dehydrogenase